MKVCKVLGPVVATVKHPKLHAQKLLIVEPVDAHGDKVGDAFIAMDSVQAGEGDLVLVMQEGSGARQILNDSAAPVRSMIIGIVDQVEVAELPRQMAAPAANKRSIAA
jgi:ethanolamine utilization protein EutN